MRFVFDGDMALWIEFFERGVESARDPAVNREVAERLVGITRRNIVEHGVNRDWPELAEATVLARLRHQLGGTAPLVRTGTLLRSIEPGTGPDYAEAGTDLGYAVHQFELRDPFGLRPGDETDIEELLADRLFGAGGL